MTTLALSKTAQRSIPPKTPPALKLLKLPIIIHDRDAHGDTFEIIKNTKIPEIGCGTGQATERFLKTGANLLAIEPGEKMASFCTEKFNENENFKIINTTFENAELGESQYDLVFSATAFHWVDEKIGYKKILDILKKNGAVALFWNKPFLNKKDDLLHVEIQKIYKKYRPLENEPIEIDYELYNKRKAKIEKYGFEWKDERWPRVIQFGESQCDPSLFKSIISDLAD